MENETNDKFARTPVGNAAAMRKALCEIVMLTIKVGYSIRGDVACGIIASKAKNALAMPPRNCDLEECSTDDGMISAHERFCESWHDDGKTCAECPYNSRSRMTTCREKWLLSPAAERKGEGDGR